MLTHKSEQSDGPDSTLRFAVLLAVVLSILLVGAVAAHSQQPTPLPSTHSDFEHAETLLKEGKASEALSLLVAVAAKNPEAPGLQAELGKAYFQSRRFPDAVQHLKAALQENARDRQAAQLLAISFYSLGNCRDALPLLEKLGPQMPKNVPNAPFLLSVCYVMTDQLDKARDSLAHSFLVPPDSAMAYLTLAKLLVRQGKVETAKPQIETALRLNPQIAMAHFLSGEIDLYQSNPQGALTEFQNELAVNPTLWLVYWRLGDAYMRLEKYDEAEKALKEAIWLNDGSANAIALLGEIALKKNDPALASGFLERALSLDPQNLEAHESLAQAYTALGREAEAKLQRETAGKLRSERHAGDLDSAPLAP